MADRFGHRQSSGQIIIRSGRTVPRRRYDSGSRSRSILSMSRSRRSAPATTAAPSAPGLHRLQPGAARTDVARRIADRAVSASERSRMVVEGEPMPHEGNPQDRQAVAAGIDTCFITNATVVSRFRVEALPHVSWISVSLNAGTAETYARIHQTSRRLRQGLQQTAAADRRAQHPSQCARLARRSCCCRKTRRDCRPARLRRDDPARDYLPSPTSRAQFQHHANPPRQRLPAPICSCRRNWSNQ